MTYVFLKGNVVVLPEHTVLLNVHVQENMCNQSELCHSEMEYICTYTPTYIQCGSNMTGTDFV